MHGGADCRLRCLVLLRTTTTPAASSTPISKVPAWCNGQPTTTAVGEMAFWDVAVAMPNSTRNGVLVQRQGIHGTGMCRIRIAITQQRIGRVAPAVATSLHALGETCWGSALLRGHRVPGRKQRRVGLALRVLRYRMNQYRAAECPVPREPGHKLALPLRPLPDGRAGARRLTCKRKAGARQLLGSPQRQNTAGAFSSASVHQHCRLTADHTGPKVISALSTYRRSHSPQPRAGRHSTPCRRCLQHPHAGGPRWHRRRSDASLRSSPQPSNRSRLLPPCLCAWCTSCSR